jgi:hypothetical protein
MTRRCGFYALIGDDDGVFGCMSLLGCDDVCPKDLPLGTQIASCAGPCCGAPCDGPAAAEPAYASTADAVLEALQTAPKRAARPRRRSA